MGKNEQGGLRIRVLGYIKCDNVDLEMGRAVDGCFEEAGVTLR